MGLSNYKATQKSKNYEISHAEEQYQHNDISATVLRRFVENENKIKTFCHTSLLCQEKKFFPALTSILLPNSKLCLSYFHSNPNMKEREITKTGTFKRNISSFVVYQFNDLLAYANAICANIGVSKFPAFLHTIFFWRFPVVFHI